MLELGKRITTFAAFMIQGAWRDKDLISPMPEATQTVSWNPAELWRLAKERKEPKLGKNKSRNR